MASGLLLFKGMKKLPHYTRTAKWEKILAGEYIPLFGGRPLRSDNIKKDDLIDLAIILNTTRSVDEFIARL